MQNIDTCYIRTYKWGGGVAKVLARQAAVPGSIPSFKEVNTFKILKVKVL